MFQFPLKKNKQTNKTKQKKALFQLLHISQLLHLYIYIYIYICWVQVTPGVTLNNVTPLNIFELDANFKKSTVKLHYLHIFSILTKFQGDQRFIVMLSINCLNSNFCSLK